MSAFNFESGSGKQSDDFLFSKNNNNNNDNKNTLRFDEILDLTEQNDKQQDTKKRCPIEVFLFKNRNKIRGIKRKTLFREKLSR